MDKKILVLSIIGVFLSVSYVQEVEAKGGRGGFGGRAFSSRSAKVKAAKPKTVVKKESSVSDIKTNPANAPTKSTTQKTVVIEKEQDSDNGFLSGLAGSFVGTIGGNAVHDFFFDEEENER